VAFPFSTIFACFLLVENHKLSSYFRRKTSFATLNTPYDDDDNDLRPVHVQRSCGHARCFSVGKSFDKCKSLREIFKINPIEKLYCCYSAIKVRIEFITLFLVGISKECIRKSVRKTKVILASFASKIGNMAFALAL